jgi:hypothetical protein
MEVYAGAVFQYYSHVENEGMSWDQEDERYVGSTYDTWDLVKDEIGEPSDNEAVVQEIIDSLGDNVWCEKNPYGLSGTERYESTWETFCETVKHEIRATLQTGYAHLLLRCQGIGPVFRSHSSTPNA